MARPKLRLSLSLALAGAAPLTTFALESTAYAQLQQGEIKGVVQNEDTGRPLAGVTVVVSGPALQGDQTEVTDGGGRYQITQLPPGDNYVVRFYYNDVIVERPGIRVTQNKSLTVSLRMPTQKGAQRAIVIRERAPNVDTATANVGVEINQEILQNTAVRGRGFESVLTLAPGAVDPPKGAGGDIGISISGSTGNENSFIIDGLNTTEPNLGVQGTSLNQYFVKEVQVITGGYQAEYGRATGGIVSVVTKSGGDEFHGGVFFSVAPFQLTPKTVARLGEAIGIRRSQPLEYDLGFELGGPILKKRIWFYAGIAPTFTSIRNERAIRAQVPDAMGRPQLDSDFSCPTYLADPRYCNGPRLLAYRTQELATQELNESRARYNWIGKLQFNLSPDHNIQLGYIGAPEGYEGYVSSTRRIPLSALFHNPEVTRFSLFQQIHDVTARYVGRFFDRKLEIELMYGFHYQGSDERPDVPDKPRINYRARPTDPYSLADFEPWEFCKRRQVGASTFNPCPITDYETNGYGQYFRTALQRHVAIANATWYAKALGAHAIKLGFNFEDVLSDNFRTYSGPDIDPNDPFSGHRYYRTSADGTQLQVNREYFSRNPDRSPVFLNGFRGNTQTRNFAIFLRDSWTVSFLPGLVLNLGVRWEGQEIFGQDSLVKNIAIYDNWAPRVGAVYDFTRKGRSKLYVNYGRFYESVPLNINDRQFTSEGLRSTRFTDDCAQRQLQPGGRPVPFPAADAGRPCTQVTGNLNGGADGAVAPGLKGQFIDEVVAGVQYEVGWDVVLGAAYTYRKIGTIIEDLSTDGGEFYIIGNPGVAPDPAEVKRLQDRIASTTDENVKRDLQSALNAYVATPLLFPPAKRDYHALTLTATKRLSNRFSVLANYVYARTYGNYPGTFSPINGQLDPNISSQYDLVDLLANRNGPLPTDRPHNLKLTGYYQQPVLSRGTFVASLTFTAYSGRPIEVLGAHPAYSVRQVFILPQGSGGRTPMVTQFDLHLGYEHKLTKAMNLSVYADVINLFNQQEVINVDDEYTASVVGPLLYGKPEDLRRLHALDGSAVVPNSNYGQPTGYQAPLYMRFGARLTF